MKDILITELKELLQENLRNVLMIVKTAEQLQVTNELFYINYEIELSQLATKDHNV